MRQLALLVIVALVSLPLSAQATNPQHIPPTAVTLVALTAKKLNTLSGLCFVTIQNKDAASIWYGYDSTVTAANGIEITAGSAPVSITLTYTGALAATAIWLYSTPGTAANAVHYTGAC